MCRKIKQLSFFVQKKEKHYVTEFKNQDTERQISATPLSSLEPRKKKKKKISNWEERS